MWGKRIYWIAYAVIVAALTAGVFFVRNYTRDALERYEASQPELLMDEFVSQLREAAASGKIENKLDLTALSEDVRAGFEKELSEAENWEYREASFGYKDGKKKYYVLADKKMVCEVTLDCISSETVMLILTVTDWALGEVTVRVEEEKGEDVFADFYKYSFELPEGYRVTCGGESVEPVSEKLNANGMISYSFTSTETEYLVYDYFGNSRKIKHGQEFSTEVVSVKIPSSYGLGLVGEEECSNAFDWTAFISENEKIPELYRYEDLYAFSDVPTYVTYSFEVLEPPCLFVVDNLGKRREVAFKENRVEILTFAKEASVPETVADEVDVMEEAKLWTLFVSDDVDKNVSGSQHGFKTTVKNHLVPDTQLYTDAYKAATGVDITFFSSHTFDNPKFSDESIDSFIMLSEDLFVVNIKFTKNLIVGSLKKKQKDRNENTFCFLKNEEGDGNKWRILMITADSFVPFGKEAEENE